MILKQQTAQPLRQTYLESYFETKKGNQLKEIQDSSSSQDHHDQLIEVQPILSRHFQCCDECLKFTLRKAQIKELKISFTPIDPLNLEQAAIYLNNYLEERIQLVNATKAPKVQQKLKKKKTEVLNNQQRQQIITMQQIGYKNGVIASILNITPGQVRMNKKVISSKKCRFEIAIKNHEIKWIMDQIQKDFNQSVFNAAHLLVDFRTQFPKCHLKLGQFRRLLHSLDIHYRIPQLKPLSFFIKQGKNEQVKEFIEQTCGFLFNGYKLIFIDETSFGSISKFNHKQWAFKNQFKQSIQRVFPFRCIMAAMGQNNFFQYQMIQGTGRALIFQEFITNIIEKALLHYNQQEFVIILDNCSIHKEKEVKKIMKSIPHIYTPVYRPEFNGIEHLFGWLKKEIVRSQPISLMQFNYSVHQVFNKLQSSFISEWCQSIIKPMLEEVKYLLKEESQKQ